MTWKGDERREDGDRLTTLEDKVDHLTASVEGLVTAWNTAGGMVRLVKWVSGAVVGMAILWKMFKDSL